jgi:Fe-S oxidoreductase
MTMTPEMQQTFALFYGMVGEIGELAQPTEMADEERVRRAKHVFLTKLDADMAVGLESCIHCGMCAEACHYYIGTGDPKYTPIRKLDLLKRVYRREMSPLRWVHRLYTPEITARELKEWQELVYDSCTECGRCSFICPMGIHIADMVILNREALAEAGLVPAELRAMQQGQLKSGTIFEAGPDILHWRLKELGEQLGFEIPVDQPHADVMVLTSGLDIMLFTDALAGTAKVMNHMGVKWSFCTQGYESANFGLLSGHEDTQRAASTKIIEAAVSCGIKTIITPECGHAFPSLRWYGAEMYGKPLPFEVMSISEYLGAQLKAGRLKVKKIPGNRKVTWHDPCKIGRMGGSFDEPRAVIEALGLQLEEPAANRELNFCCGGGAGVFLIKKAADLRHKTYQMKMTQYKQTAAESLVVSCGSCRLNFEAGKLKAQDTMPVDSFVALVAENLA